MRHLMTLLVAVLAYAPMAQAEDAVAVLESAAGNAVGLVEFEDSTNGLLVDIELNDISAGWHAIHVHEQADCSGDGFKTAGGHAAGHKSHGHGFMHGKGMHAGDMPNIWVHRDGTAKAQAFLYGVTLSELLDADGAAVILHENADDYASQPSGAAGPRIACGKVVD